MRLVLGDCRVLDLPVDVRPLALSEAVAHLGPLARPEVERVSLLHGEHSDEVEGISHVRPPGPVVDPARSHALRLAVKVEILARVAGEVSAGMHNVEPVCVHDDRDGLEHVQWPLVLEERLAVVSLVLEDVPQLESLDSSEHASHDDEQRCAVEHDEQGAHVLGHHLGLDAAVVDDADQGDKGNLDNALQDHGDGHKGRALDVPVLVLLAITGRHPGGANGGERLDERAQKDKDVDDAVRVDDGVHR